MVRRYSSPLPLSLNTIEEESENNYSSTTSEVGLSEQATSEDGGITPKAVPLTPGNTIVLGADDNTRINACRTSDLEISNSGEITLTEATAGLSTAKTSSELKEGRLTSVDIAASGADDISMIRAGPTSEAKGPELEEVQLLTTNSGYFSSSAIAEPGDVVPLTPSNTMAAVAPDTVRRQSPVSKVLDLEEVPLTAVNPEHSAIKLPTDSESRIYRKVDKRLLVWYCLIFVVLRISTGNIANAAIINLEQGTGIKKQLGNLTSTQWAWVMSIFYYPYIAFDAVSVVLMKRYKPKVWMSRIMITWGAISMCQAATNSYAGLLACRFFLGLAEAGYGPAAVYHLSFWFPADSLALRIGLLHASAVFSGAFSGFLAFGISFLNGAGGLPGWRYLFLLEGAPAFVVGIATCFVLPDYPEDAKFLSQAERDTLKRNFPDNQPTGESKDWDWTQARDLFKDPVTYGFGIIWTLQTIGACCVMVVLPQVVYDLGLRGTAISQLLTIPASALTCASLLFFGWAVQSKRLHPWKTALTLDVFVLACYIVLLIVRNSWARYTSLIVVAGPSVSVHLIILPERVRTARGTTAAALAIGLTAACANLMGIVGPHLYSTDFGPYYQMSYSIAIGLLVAAMATISGTWWLIHRRDMRQAKIEEVYQGYKNQENKRDGSVGAEMIEFGTVG